MSRFYYGDLPLIRNGFTFGVGSGSGPVGPGVCSVSSPAMIHLDMIGNNFYTRTAGQIGVTSHLFSDLVSFARTGSATIINSSGDVDVIADGAYRLGNYIDTGAGLFNGGLLKEDAATNLALQSTDLQNASWNDVGVTTAAPDADGFFNVVPDTGSNGHRIDQGGMGPVALSDVVSAQVKVKANGYNFVRIRINAEGGDTGGITGGSFAFFNLSTGTVGSQGFGTSSIQSLGNDEYLISHSTVVTASGTVHVHFHPIDQDYGNQFNTWTGDGVSGVLFKEPQFEVGVPSSYIATASSTATRNAETMQINAATLSTVFGGSMPAALSVAVEGHVTYADTNSSPEVLFFNYRTDADNGLDMRLATIGGDTGELIASQEAGGVTSAVQSDGGAYSPGTNVPISIASRHGSTFVNAAHNGTLLTEDATPTSLADLIAANFEIMPTGNMNISSITIWADDITDQGLDDATTEASGFNPLCPFDGGTPPVVPTLTLPFDTATGQTTADIGADTDIDNGTFYWVVVETSDQPTATQIENGLDHNGDPAGHSGSSSVSTTGTQTINVILLDAETTYYAHMMHKDASGGQSSPVSGDGFTTDAASGPPVLTNPTDAANGQTASTGSVDTDGDDGVIKWVISESATQPSQFQMTFGLDHNGNPAPDSGTEFVFAAGTINMAGSGLTAGTQYYTHFMHSPNVGDDSLVVTASGFTTDP